MREQDRFRTALSLLGVAVGVFAIVAALTVVDSVQRAVRDSFEDFGSDVLFIEKQPLEPDLTEDGVFRWWVYAERPAMTWREYRYLQEHASEAYASLAFVAYGRAGTGVAGDWQLLVRQPLQEGRVFTQQELETGAPVALVGSEVERSGAMVWLEGEPYRVIGVFRKAGAGVVSPVDIDRVCLIPYKSMSEVPLRTSILAAGAEEAALRARLREVRRLPAGRPDNFAFNRLSFLMDEMTEIFQMVSKAGWLIGLFALLVGGFGVANILYVSVEERKPQIGLCRALGARRRVIVRQFLTEAVVLSALGGLAGIGLVWIATLVLNRLLPGGSLQIILSLKATLSGLVVSAILGLAFGAAPARSAALLDPIVAMRDK
ncbi:MAG: ABC transporter permease [Bacteroidales bacterium]|nr:ABC transporter permease [Bacteroidales bacterium]